MARLFATVALLFLAGGGIATAVTGNAWPLICVCVALFFLVKVFSSCENPEPKTRTPKTTYHRGRKDMRMPS